MVITITAIRYLTLPHETRPETIAPHTRGPSRDEARSASPKYAKTRLCFPCGAMQPIIERETAHVAPYHNPNKIAATTKSVKFVSSASSGNIITYPVRINCKV